MWEGSERDWSAKAYGRKCEIECSAGQKRGPTVGHEWTMQGNGPECFSHLALHSHI